MIFSPPSPPFEVVDDSEPEREQQRRLFKQRRREERKLKKQQQLLETIKDASGSRSSGTGEGFSPAGSSTGVVESWEEGGGEGGETSSSTREARPGSSPFSSLSPVQVTTRPIDFSSYAYAKPKSKPSSSNSLVPAAPTTSFYFPPRPSTSSTCLSVDRRSKSKSVDLTDASPECSFKVVEMRRLKKCVLCGEDWSQPGKKTRTKWAHIINCTPSPSHSAVCDLIRKYLDITKAGGEEPKSLLEKMSGVKEEAATELWDADPSDDDVVVLVDQSKLGKGKGRERTSRSTSIASKASSRVASVPARQEDEEEDDRSPSPSAPSLATTAISPLLATVQNKHLSNFAYDGAPKTLNGGIKAGLTSVPKLVVPHCTIRDIEMRKVKSCLFCPEDWSTGKKAVKVKWAHLYSCSLLATPLFSLALLTNQIVTHLAAPEPKTLLESLTMMKPKAKGRKMSAVTSLVLPAGNEVARASVMRNVESLMGGGDEARRGEDNDNEMEEMRPPPATQAFGTSGLAARFGARKGVEQQKKSLWDVGEGDDEAGPSRLGGLSSEDDNETGSGSSTDYDDEEIKARSTGQDRPGTSLWGMAAESTASQLERAGDENILSPPSSSPPKFQPTPLTSKQSVISISSSDSDSPLPTALTQRPASASHHSISSSSSENSRSAAARRRTSKPDEESSLRFDSEEPEGKGEASSISQGQEWKRKEMMSDDGDEGVGRVKRGEEEDMEDARRSNRSWDRTKRDASIISIYDHDADDPQRQHQHQNASRNQSHEPSDDLFSPSHSRHSSFPSSSGQPIRGHDNISSPVFQLNANLEPFPNVDFWSNSPRPFSSSRSDPPSHSTPACNSNLGSIYQHDFHEVIELADDENDWGDEGVIRWDGEENDVAPPRDASTDEEVEFLDILPRAALAFSPMGSEECEVQAVVVVDEDDEEGEPYDQSDDRWGEEGVLVWDDVVGDGDEELGVEGGVAEHDMFEDIEEEEPRRVEPVKKKAEKKTKKKASVMPDYEEMPIAQLQKIMRFTYGTKPPSSRPQLLRLLRENWWLANPPPSSSVLDPDVDDEEDSDLPSPSRGKRSAPRRKAVLAAHRGCVVIDSDSDGQQQPSKGKGKARVASRSDDDSDVPFAESTSPRKKRAASSQMVDGVTIPLEELPEVFRAMILENEDLWLRVLRYEPIDFQEFVTCVHQCKVKTKGWQTALRKWLDSQSLTYFTEEQTGSRRRH